MRFTFKTTLLTKGCNNCRCLQCMDGKNEGWGVHACMHATMHYYYTIISGNLFRNLSQIPEPRPLVFEPYFTGG